MKEMQTVTIDWVGSLYDPNSAGLIAKLEEVAANAKNGGIILLNANNACHDYHQSWLDGLSTGHFWEDLAAHFQRVHLLLIEICVSKSKWYFVSSDDCLGSWWDLALSCHGRIWANPYAKVGYPEVYIDLIPPLASGGLRRYATYQTLEDCRNNAILHAKDAYTKGLISLVLQGHEWAGEEGISSLYAWIKKSPPLGNLRSTTKPELIKATPDILGIVELRSALQTRRKQIASSHLDAGFQILRERNLNQRANAMASVRAGGAARFLFEDYRSWLSRRISRYQIGSKDKWWTRGDGSLLIDLSSGVPPQSLIQSLISRNIRLTLMAPTEGLLKDGVETVLSRSQKGGQPRRDVMNSWRGKVDWVVGEVKSAKTLWMACTGNDMIEFGYASNLLLSQFRLSGNYGQAGLGWSELVFERATKDDESMAGFLTAAEEIADILTNGVLRRSRWSHVVSVTVALRICLMSEMLLLAKSGQWPDILEQCKLLIASGWGFAADISQWDGMLRNFAQEPDLEAAVKELGFECREILDNPSVAALRMKISKPSHVARFDISSARLSRHFEAFAVQMGRKLLKLGVADSEVMADLFVTLAWGYPGKSPVPSDLAVELGEGRIKLWAEIRSQFTKST